MKIRIGFKYYILVALNYGDIVALEKAALIESHFTKNIKDNRANEIHTAVEQNLDTLNIPKKAIATFKMEKSMWPPLPGLEK